MHIRVVTSILAQAAIILAVCPDGQVGVGTGQLCNFTSVGATGSNGYETLITQCIPSHLLIRLFALSDCGSQDGRIFANDCGIIATTTSVFSEGFCDATWDNGASVECDDNDVPTLVVTQGGNFGNCVAVTSIGESGVCTPDAALFGPGVFAADFCCSRV
jgi:hypothetical protein